MLIAGDIGGTKTDLAIYSSEAGPHSPLAQAQMHSADYPSLQEEFMERMPIHVITTRAALIGAATFGLESLKGHKE